MPTRDHYTEGVPCWADLATTDVGSATDFYSDLFGWRFEKLETDSVPYWMAYRKDLVAAGVGPAQEGQEFSVWTTYFAVDDTDLTVEKIEEAGGQVIMSPLDVSDAGRMAIAADPTGAVFAIWQAGRRIGASIVNEHGGLNWNELQTTDTERAVSFYEDVFGHTHRTTEGGAGPYTLLSVADREIAGVMAPPAPDIPNSWGVYFAVDDAAAALQTAKDAGGSAITDTIDIPGAGILAVLADPAGAPFTVIQLTIDID